jgi:hypothetical protein
MRDVTITWTNSQMVGDEIIELWLKKGAAAWAQEAQVLLGASSQSRTFPELEAGVDHVFQARARRGGQYRPEYTSSDPENWPVGSRLEFVPSDAVTPAGAPTITNCAWERTGSTATNITITAEANPAHESLDLQLVRGASTVVATVSGPHSGPVQLVDNDPPVGVAHTYRVRHIESGVPGAASSPIQCYAGPSPPPSGIQFSGVYDCGYEVSWTHNIPGAVTQVLDDWPGDSFQEVALAAADVTSAIVTKGNQILCESGAGQVPVAVRLRHGVETFGVTDWTQPVQRSDLLLCDDCVGNGGFG